MELITVIIMIDLLKTLMNQIKNKKIGDFVSFTDQAIEVYETLIFVKYAVIVGRDNDGFFVKVFTAYDIQFPLPITYFLFERFENE